MRKSAPASGSRTLTVRIPIAIRRRGGQKLVVAPDGTTGARVTHGLRVNNAIVMAIARAFRWRKRLESGTYATIAELANAERVNPSYVSRVLRLTLLAPNVIEAILDGQQPPNVSLVKLMEPFPNSWREQVKAGLSVPDCVGLRARIGDASSTRTEPPSYLSKGQPELRPLTSATIADSTRETA